MRFQPTELPFTMKSVNPDLKRLWYLADAFRLGYSVTDAYHATKIDPWFLAQIKELVDIEERIKETSGSDHQRRNVLLEEKRIL